MDKYKEINEIISKEPHCRGNYVTFPNFNGDDIHVLTEKGRELLSYEGLIGYNIVNQKDQQIESLKIELKIQTEIAEKSMKQIKQFEEGFKGACSTCEPVGILNKRQDQQIKVLREALDYIDQLKSVNKETKPVLWFADVFIHATRALEKFKQLERDK